MAKNEYPHFNPTKYDIQVKISTVKRYIMEQQGKDVFEYSVYGNSKQKIGDFTQGRLFL